MRRLKLDEIEGIAKDTFKTRFAIASLSDIDRRNLTFDYTVEGDLAVCRYYVANERPQDGKTLAEMKINRETGEVLEYLDRVAEKHRKSG